MVTDKEFLNFLNELESEFPDSLDIQKTISAHRKKYAEKYLEKKKPVSQPDETGDLDVEKLTEILGNCGINVVDLR